MWHSFRNRLALVIGFFTIFIGLGVIYYISTIASQKITHASTLLLQSIATSMSNTLSSTLLEREREIALMSKNPLFLDASRNKELLFNFIEEVQTTYPNYSWIDVTDEKGVVTVASDRLLEGINVSSRPWFQNGLLGRYIGDVHEAALLAKMLKPLDDPNEPLRFIDFASPILNTDGTCLGVVVAHANWGWIKKVLASSLPEDADKQGIRAYIISAEGEILYPYESIQSLKIPQKLLQHYGSHIVEWDDKIPHLSIHTKIAANVSTDLGWSIVVSWPIEKALEAVNALNKTLLYIGLCVVFFHIILAYRLAIDFSRPIETLALFAKRITQGNHRATYATSCTLSEVRVLEESIKTMVTTLVSHEEALEKANQTLEHKVHERTLELQTANEKLNHLARHDVLTQLHNRLAANEVLHAEFLRLKRTQALFCVALMDIDHFKNVNDTYGHDVGDTVLSHVASLIRSSIRNTDFVARFGGEEFFLLLPDTPIEGAEHVAQKIRQCVENAPAPHHQKLTLSIGVAISWIDMQNEDDVVRKADEALYKAKANGRNQVVLA